MATHGSPAALRLVEPEFNSSLATTILELEKLRVKRLGGRVPPYVFHQVKEIFQFMESLGSARIEGNRTTLAQFVEEIIAKKTAKKTDETLLEILNIEEAITFINDNVKKGDPVTRILISEVHKKVTAGLTPPPEGEGSRTPGAYRIIPVTILGAEHSPPTDGHSVTGYMDELFAFINRSDFAPQHHLLVTAIAHHRMAWVHPFDNGNGRTVRMLTYAMLVAQGFRVGNGRILNPTAVFCMDREKYSTLLAGADSGEKKAVLEWCEYVLGGLLSEIQKVDRLLDRDYLDGRILLPALVYARERKLITRDESLILTRLVGREDMAIKSADLEKALGKKISPVQRSRTIKGLKNRGMLVPLTKNGRSYTIGFVNNYLLRGVLTALEAEGFVPATLNQK